MVYASLFIEFIRVRPRLVLWTAALAQAALWTLVPALFYSAPPGDVAEILAVGHAFRLGTDLGPPLAYWLAEIAFDAAGGHVFGVYLLSQICVVITYWAVFQLGRAIVGASHAVMAVLLLVGVSALTMATPNFTPELVAMPLWAMVLLHYWRAVGEGRGNYWFALAIDIGLLLLTAHAGLLLVALVIAFTLRTERGRAQLDSFKPWAAGIVSVIILFPYLLWIDRAGIVTTPSFSPLFSRDAADHNLTAWFELAGALLAANAGLIVLVALASKFWVFRRDKAPEVDRPPVAPFARTFVYYFALTPALVMTVFAVLTGQATIVAAPLLALSGLAVITAMKDRIHIHYQHFVQLTWFALLIVPPAFTAASVLLAPWTIAAELRVTLPMREMGRFFSESFERRTNQPLSVVTGDSHLAALVALGAPRRASLYLEGAPANSASVNREELVRKGAIVVWPTTDLTGTPPPQIKAQFPDLVAETPRAFERPVQGLLPLLRDGWGVVRPQGQSSAPALIEPVR
jgi:4-amino-4-deoxy-L-arabinose transferase-like glycosyltransferase